jgi:hypothetical protein
MPPLFFFYQQTWRLTAFCHLQLIWIAGWLWRLPQAEQAKLTIERK